MGQFGSTLASFVFHGQCVVVGTYGNCTVREAPGGLWRDKDLNPIQMLGQKYETQQFRSLTSTPASDSDDPLGTAISEGVKGGVAGHPMLTGVEKFETRNNIATGGVKEGAEVVGVYTSGRPMVVWMKAEGEGEGGVVSLNFVPSPGDGDVTGGWLAVPTTEVGQAGRMVANALWWALNNEWSASQITKINLV